MSDSRRFMDRVFSRRKAEIEREWQAIVIDAERWNRTHPDEQPIIISPVTTEEIEALQRATPPLRGESEMK